MSQDVEDDSFDTDNGVENEQGNDSMQLSLDNPQEEAERRNVRTSYRSIYDQIESSKHELLQPGTASLSQILAEANNAFKNVHNASEFYLDSVVLAEVASLGAQRAQRLSAAAHSLDPELLPEMLLSQAESGPDINFWTDLGKKALGCLKGRTPTVDFMLGPLEYRLDRAQIVRQRRAYDRDTGPQIHPQDVTDETVSGGDSTNAEVKRLLSYVQALGRPMSLFEFAVDPVSFAATVENIFHLSFLVKEGCAKISFDSNGLPIISSAQPPSLEESGSVGWGNQFVLELTYDDWQKVVAEFALKEPHIPRRREHR